MPTPITTIIVEEGAGAVAEQTIAELVTTTMMATTTTTTKITTAVVAAAAANHAVVASRVAVANHVAVVVNNVVITISTTTIVACITSITSLIIMSVPARAYNHAAATARSPVDADARRAVVAAEVYPWILSAVEHLDHVDVLHRAAVEFPAVDAGVAVDVDVHVAVLVPVDIRTSAVVTTATFLQLIRRVIIVALTICKILYHTVMVKFKGPII